MFLYPEMHAMWKWIHNNFRCSSSCVMCIRVPERDYFLVGENRFVLNGFAFFRAVICWSFFWYKLIGIFHKYAYKKQIRNELQDCMTFSNFK